MRPQWVRSSSFDTETAATHLFDDTPSETMTDEDDRSGLLFRAQSFASNIS